MKFLTVLSAALLPALAYAQDVDDETTTTQTSTMTLTKTVTLTEGYTTIYQNGTGSSTIMSAPSGSGSFVVPTSTSSTASATTDAATVSTDDAEGAASSIHGRYNLVALACMGAAISALI